MGFGCWNNGWGVWCGAERKTTRRVCVARRSTTAGAVSGGAVQRRKTAPTPSSTASSESGTVRSPATTSTVAGNPAVAGRRVSARTGTPASSSSVTTAPPIRPVAPVTRTGCTCPRVTMASAESIARRRNSRLADLPALTLRQAPRSERLAAAISHGRRCGARDNTVRATVEAAARQRSSARRSATA
jgi:hypothetical protein